MKRFVVVLLIMALAVTLMSGCFKRQETAGKLKLAMVLPGSINDAGWNAAAYQGLMRLKEAGKADVAYSEGVAQADIETTLRDYAARGYELIIGHGFQFGDPIVKVSKDFPKARFWCINGAVQGPNYASLRFANWETDYVLGVLAAHMTKTNKLGGVAAQQIPSMVRPMEAFKAGAKSVNPNIKVTVTYTGSMEDVAKAKEATLALIDAGCDIIHQAADKAGHGVIEACVSRNVYVFGNTLDQNHLAPNHVLSSSLRNVDKLLELAIQHSKADPFVGKVYVFGLKEDAVSYAPFHGLDAKVPANVKALMAQTRQDILDGKSNVPILDNPTPD